MHRDHRFSKRHISDALDGALPPRQQARLARHVDDCPECGPMLQSLIRLRATLRSIADADDHCGPSVVPGVLQALRRHDGSAVPPGSSRVHRA